MKQRIQEDVKQAMRERDEIKVGALRMLLSSLLNKEKEKRYTISKDDREMAEQELNEKAALGVEEIQDIISSEVKKRREAIEGFEKGQRPEMAEKERKEMEILQQYLPEQLSEEQVRELVRQAVEKTGAQSAQDMGKVMAAVMPEVKGRADGSLVANIVKDLLTL